MKTKQWKKIGIIISFFALAAIALSGCGSSGSAGAAGAAGPAGPAGPVTLTSESCVTCHNASDVANISAMHDYTFDAATGARTTPRLSERNYRVAITNVENIGGFPKITFTVHLSGQSGFTTAGGNVGETHVTTLTSQFLSRIIIARLIPAGVGTNTYASPYWETWSYQSGVTPNPVPPTANGAAVVNPVVATFDATGAATGTYSVTLPDAWGTASTYAPLTTYTTTAASGTTPARTAAYNRAVAQPAKATNYALGTTLRVYLRVNTPSLRVAASTAATTATQTTGNTATPVGITTAERAALWGPNNLSIGAGTDVFDFAAVPALGAAAAKIATQNQVVDTWACYQCHGPQLAGTGHGSSYRDNLGCVLCHSPLFGDARWTTDRTFVTQAGLMHRIHAASTTANLSYGPTVNFAEITYPQPVSNCVACHSTVARPADSFTNTAAQTAAAVKTAMGTGDKIDNWKNVPSAEVCGSCHPGANFTTGVGHFTGLPATNATCTLCHTAAAIVSKHTPAAAAKDVPEYTATMTITAPAAGTFYVAGETPTVTVTLKDATGAAAPAALYTTAAKTTNGTTTPSQLRTARLYVYGPRANARPVLTKAAATLSATGVPGQAQSLFVSTTDAQVLTDSTGFKYKLTAIPATMTAGTYMIRFSCQNYGRVDDTNYKIDSTAFTHIQIGTATEEQMIAGTTSDACTNCHYGLLAIHNARHSVSFTTHTNDECLACHDRSGNHAQALAWRVHAIHSASKTADLVAGETPALDWSEIGYTQGQPSGRNATTGLVTATGANRCITCHTSTSGTGILWKTTGASKRGCIGCHADKPGATDHMLQNGGI